MAETLEKLRPDRDLQCYFYQPSAIAALSAASASGFTVSGCWRQQFDWAVIEWNRDNVFEHPAFRNLPDGDLSGLVLAYQETRTNCIPLDSSWYPTVDWPYLRVWAGAAGAEQIYKVRLSDHASPVEGTYGSASAIFELQGAPTALDYIELAWLDEHYTYQLYGTDTLETAAQAVVDSINTFSHTMTATRSGTLITLQYAASAGANANRIGVYANVSGGGTESWQPAWQLLRGGTSPSKWSIALDFSSLKDVNGVAVPTNAVRKLRWTYAADVQPGAFERSEFQVTVSNWTVSGSNRGYSISGPGSRRIEDDAAEIIYSGQWRESRGNFSGGSVRYATTPGASLACTYTLPRSHQLYLGTRKADACGQVTIVVDGVTLHTENLALAGEDVLMRVPLGQFAGGVPHSVRLTHTGAAGTYFYFDFLEASVATAALPVFAVNNQTTLATDWDTLHSAALAAERTAWLIHTLGFQGRANHYAGALWFYELVPQGYQYATATVTFNGTPEFGKTTTLNIGPTPITHMSLIGDTAASVAKAFDLLINQGSTGVWAQASGATLTIQARAIGTAGNGTAITVSTNSQAFTAATSGAGLAGGIDGNWRTDLAATPRLNRAARDWHFSFFQALKSYGIDVTAAFSMELGNGDPSAAAGIAQCYPDASPVMLNTPALQTNFSPASLAFWKQAYLDMANIQVQAGLQPFLQFGEVQWWYFPKPGVGMTFYDAYTTSTFAAAHGHALPVFLDGNASPALYPQECAYLAGLIGSFTDAIMTFTRQSVANARFEVLYPPDTNAAPLMGAVNLPASSWSAARLDCFKTENFTYSGDRDLNKVTASVMLPMQLGFTAPQSAHLVGIGDYTTPWQKENQIAQGARVSSVVLFALDQFCLIGYPLPLDSPSSRSLYMGR
jgi:hypothetical protein